MTAQTVYVAGTAMTGFGRSDELDLLGLAVRAGRDALADGNVDPADVDVLYVGGFLAQSLQHQGVLASLVARELGLGTVPATALEGACASAGIALRHGIMSCRAGMARTVLCLGFEQMSRHPLAEVTAGRSEALEATTDQRGGLTFAGFFGLAQAHADRYGTTREQLAAVSVKNRSTVRAMSWRCSASRSASRTSSRAGSSPTPSDCSTVRRSPTAPRRR